MYLTNGNKNEIQYKKYLDELRSLLQSTIVDDPININIRIYNHTKFLVYNQLEKYRNKNVSINFYKGKTIEFNYTCTLTNENIEKIKNYIKIENCQLYAVLDIDNLLG